jgi:hypothetical protein
MRTGLFAMGILALPLPVCAGTPALGPFPTADVCGACHRDIYRMWQQSTHARAMEDLVFLEALWEVRARDERLSRVCLGCHAPMVAPLEDQALVRKTSWEGVTCDFCHSISAIRDDGPNPRPVLEFGNVKRGPIPGAQSSGHEVAFSKLHTESAVCAPCHEYTNAEGVPIMTTYSEWRASAAAHGGQTCQSCHMALTEAHVVDPKIKRSPESRVNLHEMPGAHSIAQLHAALRIEITPARHDGVVDLAVEIRNTGAGHAVPTGMPGRRIIMTVALEAASGERYEEQRVFAKFFEDAAARPLNHVADHFGSGVRLKSVTRLAAGDERVEAFSFAVPAEATAFVTVKLHYEHAPRGEESDHTRLTFLSERRLLKPEGGGVRP